MTTPLTTFDFPRCIVGQTLYYAWTWQDPDTAEKQRAWNNYTHHRDGREHCQDYDDEHRDEMEKK